jgi:hypothetical protein
VRDHYPKDEAGTAVCGDAVFVNARSNFVSSDGSLISIVGLDDVAAIATSDAVMVAQREVCRRHGVDPCNAGQSRLAKRSSTGWFTMVLPRGSPILRSVCEDSALRGCE